jgi:hypothetical protein
MADDHAALCRFSRLSNALKKGSVSGISKETFPCFLPGGVSSRLLLKLVRTPELAHPEKLPFTLQNDRTRPGPGHHLRSPSSAPFSELVFI